MATGSTSDRSTVVHLGISPNFSPRPAAEVRTVLLRQSIHVPYILYVGSAEPRKNLARLLEAYAVLRSWSPLWDLIIVGGGHRGAADRVTVTGQRLHLSASVHFVGSVSDDDLPYLYCGADLFVFPSVLEGFGLPVLEAMACGVPVVTSKLSSIPEIAGDAALLVDPYDVNALVDAMRRVLSDPSLASVLRTRGLVRARGFSWERTARETVAIYEKVLRTKSLVNERKPSHDWSP